MWRLPTRHSGDLENHAQSGDQNESDHPDPRFLGFLTRVVRDWGTTFRLAFLIGVVFAAAAMVLLFVRLGDQWIWVVLSSFGIHLTARLRRRVKPDGEG